MIDWDKIENDEVEKLKSELSRYNKRGLISLAIAVVIGIAAFNTRGVFGAIEMVGLAVAAYATVWLWDSSGKRTRLLRETKRDIGRELSIEEYDRLSKECRLCPEFLDEVDALLKNRRRISAFNKNRLWEKYGKMIAEARLEQKKQSLQANFREYRQLAEQGGEAS